MELHDLQYDFIRSYAIDIKEQNCRLLESYRKKCPNGWPSGPNDGYFFQYLAYHLSQAGREEELKKLLIEYRGFRITKH